MQREVRMTHSEQVLLSEELEGLPLEGADRGATISFFRGYSLGIG